MKLLSTSGFICCRDMSFLFMRVPGNGVKCWVTQWESLVKRRAVFPCDCPVSSSPQQGMKDCVSPHLAPYPASALDLDSSHGCASCVDLYLSCFVHDCLPPFLHTLPPTLTSLSAFLSLFLSVSPSPSFWRPHLSLSLHPAQTGLTL